MLNNIIFLSSSLCSIHLKFFKMILISNVFDFIKIDRKENKEIIRDKSLRIYLVDT